MIQIEGKFSNATIFTDLVEDNAISQIQTVCNNEFSKGSKIAIMSDVHCGNGCTIGTTMTITDKIVPNLVGVDIGCGMLCTCLGEIDVDFRELDYVIKHNIPSGFNSRSSIYENTFNPEELMCYSKIKNPDKSLYQIGTLGSGNHFIEVNADKNGCKYLVIHSGSRNLGKQVAEYYQDLAIKSRNESRNNERNELIAKLKDSSEKATLGDRLNALEPLNSELAYLEGDEMDAYLHDMWLCQWYADINRKVMTEIIINKMPNFDIEYKFTTTHNYIDEGNMILRKGAISAQKGEKVIIPMNMRDGSIIAIGKGNPDWNYSAPHGAGRIMGRREAKRTFKLEDFKKSMEGIYTTSVCNDTIDESPFVYKPMEEITKYIGDTVEIIDVIKTIYNFKAN